MRTIGNADVSNEDTELAGKLAPELENAISEEQAGDAFLARFLPKEDKDAEKPSKKGKKEEADASDETADDEPDDKAQKSDESPDDESQDDGDDDSEDETQVEKKFVEPDENTFVKIKVGDEELEVSVKDLARVRGQEAAVTQRSQQVAAQRKKNDEEAARNVAALDVMLTRARQRAEPFKNIDFVALARNPDVSEEDLTQLRDTAQAFIEEERFLEQEMGNFMTHIQQRQNTEREAQAQECVKALSDEAGPHYIEGWGNELYDELRTFAIDTGLNADIVNALVDPAAFKIIHNAMLYEKGKTQVKTVRVNKSPKKIVKRTNAPAPQKSSDKAKSDAAFNRLQRTGSVDDAGEAFLARFTRDSDE